jgi:hypothetical protein
MAIFEKFSAYRIGIILLVFLFKMKEFSNKLRYSITVNMKTFILCIEMGFQFKFV